MELGCDTIAFSKLSWSCIIQLLWLAVAMVGLKINEDELIGWRGVFMISLMFFRNHKRYLMRF